MPYEFVQRARSLVEGGQPQEAVKICRLGLLAKPQDLDGRIVLGAALVALRRYDEVLAEMRVALEIDPRNARALALKGEALLRKGKPGQAAEVLEHARALAPDDVDIAASYREAVAAAPEAPEGGHGGGRPATGFERESRTKHYPIHAVGSAEEREIASSSGVEPSTVEFRRRRRAGEGGFPRGSAAAPRARDEATVDEAFSDEEATTVAPVAPASDDGPFEVQRREPFVELRSVDILEERGVAEQPLAADDLERAMSQLDAEAGRADSGRPMAGEMPLKDPESVRALSARGASEFDDEHSAARTSRRGPTGPNETSQPADALAPAAAGRMASSLPGNAPEVPRSERHPTRSPAPAARAPSSAGATPDSPARVSDMRTIRAGLGLSPDTEPVPAPRRRRGGFSKVKPDTVAVGRRRGLSALVYTVVAIAAIAGGVLGGLRIRALRLQREIDAAEASAASSVRTGAYRGYLRARDVYERISRVDDSRPVRAGLARARAQLAFEFGDGIDDAVKQVGALDASDRSLDAEVARAYVALIGADAAAGAIAADVEKRFPGRAIGPYLAGYAALSAGSAAVAADAFTHAARFAHHPLAYVGLARADAASRKFSSALHALDQVLKVYPGHPEAVITRARVLAMRHRAGPAPGDHPAATAQGDLGEALAALDRVIGEGGRDVVEQKFGVSAEEVAWARLAAAEVRMAQGDKTAARAFVAHVSTKCVDSSWRFAEATASLALAVGDVSTAKREAARAVHNWPKRRAARLLLARAALAGGDADAALAALENAKDLGNDPHAWALRGRAYLQAGNLEAAAHDLDKALAAAPNLREAVIARARVDLKSGDAQAAIARLTPLYKRSNDSQVAVAYAAALRQSGKLKQARSVLQAVPAALAGPDLYVGLARLDRQEGRFDDAAAAYARAVRLDPQSRNARLEQALLALDTGDIHRAQKLLVELAKEAAGNGRVLAQAARVSTLTGAPDKASAYLDRAAKLPSTPRWLVSRERGRLALRTRHGKAAIAALQTATKLAPHDSASWLLLLDAQLTAEDGDAAQQTLQSILKQFPNSPEAELALGRDDLYTSRDADALVALRKAQQMLIQAHAPPRKLAVPLFWIGRLYYDTGDLGSSVKSLQQAIKLDPSEADAHYLLGNVQYERGDLKAAASAYDQSLKYDPASNPDAWYYLGDVSFKLGDKAAAKRALAEYKKRVPQGAYIKDADKLLAQL